MVIFFRRFRDHDFRREQQTGDRRRVLQREARDLGRIQDAGVDHVAVLARAGVVAVRALATLDLVQHHGRVFASVLDDLTQRLFDRARQDANADRLVFVRTFELVEGLLRADQRNAAARDHAFFNGGTGCVQRVFDAGLLLFHFDLGGSADLDHGNAAGELGNTLLELLLVVVRSGFFSLLTDRLDARSRRLGQFDRLLQRNERFECIHAREFLAGVLHVVVLVVAVYDPSGCRTEDFLEQL